MLHLFKYKCIKAGKAEKLRRAEEEAAARAEAERLQLLADEARARAEQAERERIAAEEAERLAKLKESSPNLTLTTSLEDFRAAI